MAKRAPTPTPTDDQLLTTNEVLERIRVNRSTLWDMVRKGRFPKPIRITNARNRYRLSSVMQWLEEREAHPVEQRGYFGRGKKLA